MSQKLRTVTGSLLCTVIILAQSSGVYAGPLGTSDPAACVTAGSTVTCTGNLSGGVEADGPAVDTLNVNTLNQAITPAGGVDGINFNDNGAATDITITSETGAFGIMTTNDDAEGILTIESGAGDQTVTSSGNFTTSGARSEGIEAIENDNGNQTVTSTGSIATTGIGSQGIDADENGDGTQSVSSNGNIATVGNNADGIQADENGNGNQMVSSSGNIVTTGNGSDGIEVNENGDGNQTLSSTSDITTTNDNSEGIRADENGNGDQMINSSGNIMTTNADGILASEVDAGNQTLTLTGNITTAGDGSDGIQADENGDGDQMLMSTGDIATTGNSAEGIDADENGNGDSTITSNGNITTAGSGSEGIEANEDGDGNLNVTSTGNITTAGDGSDGIQADENGDGDATISSNGNIAISGANASGVLVTTNLGTQTTVNLAGGSIQGGTGNGAGVNFNNALGTNVLNIAADTNMSALSGTAVRGGAGNENVNNSGTLTGNINLGDGVNTVNNFSGATITGDLTTGSGNDTFTNTGTYVGNIDLGAGDDTLNLAVGSQTTGIINGGADNDSVNILGNGPSSSMSFTNFENIHLASNVTGVVIGDTVTTVDATGHSFLGEVVNEVVTDIHQSISQRLAQTKIHSQDHLQVASLDNSAGLRGEVQTVTTWGQFFGSTRERDAEDGTLKYEHDYFGFVSGYERDLGTMRVGLVAGYANSDVETKLKSIDTKVDSYYAGGYGQRKLGLLDLTISLLGGYEDYDNKRLVVDSLNGIEQADSDFDNYFISPSITLSSASRITERSELRSLASVTYTAAFFDDYNESGTTASNLEIHNRTVQVWNARSQIAGAYFFQGGEFEVRTGIDSRFTDEDRVKANLAGSSFAFATTDDDEVFAGYVGAGLRIVDRNNLSFKADAEYRAADGGEDQLSGRLGLEYLF